MRQRFLVVLQEVRGYIGRLQRLVDDAPYTYECFVSATGVSVGGVAFLVPRHPPQQPVPERLEPARMLRSIVPGRAAALHVSPPAREHSM
eukprot:3797854-Pyramimonas_sp.AAC.1